METLIGKGTHQKTPELNNLIADGMSYFHEAINLYGSRPGVEVLAFKICRIVHEDEDLVAVESDMYPNASCTPIVWGKRLRHVAPEMHWPTTHTTCTENFESAAIEAN